MAGKQLLLPLGFCILALMPAELKSEDDLNAPKRVNAQGGKVDDNEELDATKFDKREANYFPYRNAIIWKIRFLPPLKPREFTFFPFDEAETDYIDYLKPPQGVTVVAFPQGPKEIHVSTSDIFNRKDAGSFEPKFEGNLKPKGGSNGNNGGNGGKYVPKFHWAAEMVKASVDADVDSDNNNGFGRPNETYEEDLNEDLPKNSKIIAVNNGDADSDSVKDWVDFNNKQQKFAQLIIKLPPNVKISKAKLKIEYDSPSDPANLTKEGKISLPAEGRLRIWRVAGKETRNPGSANGDYGDFVAPGVYSDLDHLNFKPTSKGSEAVLYLEGVAASPTVGAEKITVSVDADGSGTWSTPDEVAVTVFQAVLVAATDYMVPGSNRNIIRYRCQPKELAVTFASITVMDSDVTTVCTFKDELKKTLAEDDEYNELWWNACAKKTGAKPLTEAKSPYTLGLAMSVGPMVSVAKIRDRKVKEWNLTVTVPDKEAYSGATVSGVDLSTVTPSDDKFVVTRKFVGETDNEKKIAAYKLTKDNGSVNALLKSGKGAKDYFLFYTTPTEPTDVEIKYQLDLDVGEGGCLDRAGNPWDMYSNTDTIWENHGEWKFSISTDGKMNDFEEDYEEK